MTRLSDYLSMPMPEYREAEVDTKTSRRHGKKSRSTKGKSKSGWTRNPEYADVKELREWKDFNKDTIDVIFGGKLKRTLERDEDDLKLQLAPNKSQLTVGCEDSLKIYLDAALLCHVQEALERSCHKLLNQEITFGRGKKLCGVLRYRHEEPKMLGLMPDYGCRDQRHFKANFMPGDAKWRWKSTSLSNGQVIDPEARPLWPIRQLVTYGVKAHARYAFIVTEDELVAMRLGPGKDEGEDEDLNESAGGNVRTVMKDDEIREKTYNNAIVEWTAIPRTAANESKSWNMGIALFSLIMIASNNGHLIDDKEPYRPLELEPLLPFELGSADAFSKHAAWKTEPYDQNDSDASSQESSQEQLPASNDRDELSETPRPKRHANTAGVDAATSGSVRRTHGNSSQDLLTSFGGENGYPGQEHQTQQTSDDDSGSSDELSRNSTYPHHSWDAKRKSQQDLGRQVRRRRQA